MSDTTQPTPDSGTPGSAAAQDTGAGTPAPAAPAVPEGYVPVAELEREKERARGFQSELDRVKAASTKPPAAPKVPTPESDGDFDVQALLDQAVSKVYAAQSIASAAAEAKTAFPFADPSLFDAASLAQFDSPESLRYAAEASHKRVADIVAASTQETEEDRRTRLAAEAAGSTTPAGGTTPPPGDPTPEALSGMSFDDLNDLEEQNPGVIERVLGIRK